MIAIANTMNSLPSFSIITPVLNGAKFLPSVFTCLTQQTFSDWEHIIVDGGSTDGSLESATRWCEDEPRARLLRVDGLGLYPSVLKGVSEAQGVLLGWLNSDDLYAPWALSVVWKYHLRTKASWMTGYPGCWDETGNLRFVRPYGWYSQRLIRDGWHHERLLGFLQQESIFFSRDLCDQLGADDWKAVETCNMAGDFVLWMLFARHEQLKVIPTLLSGFRLHGSNLSVGRLSEYLDEVRMRGGRFLPGPVARLAGLLFRIRSTIRSLGEVQIEDALLHASLRTDETSSVATSADQV